MPGQLAKAPLVEALLEIRWKLVSIGPNTFQDPVYKFLVGRFYDRIRERFGHVETLPIAQVPDEITAYIVKQQFRVAKNGWPLVQLGPGIATLNFTSPYSWQTFEETSKFVFPKLADAYAGISSEGTDTKLIVTRILLRYINAITTNWLETDALSFLESNLHTTFGLPPEIAQAEVLTGLPRDLNLQIGYSLQKPVGRGLVRFATGRTGNRQALICELVVRSQGEDVPQLSAAETFWSWVRSAHDDVIEKWFFALIKGRLEEQFKGEQPK